MLPSPDLTPWIALRIAITAIFILAAFVAGWAAGRCECEHEQPPRQE